MTTINNIEYNLKRDYLKSNEKIYKISVNMVAPPRYLSKYYPLSERNVLSFINAKVYVSIPDQFNDIFDTLIQQINVSDMTDEDLFRVYEKTYRGHYRHKYSDIRRIIIPVLKRLWDYSIGILCLTNNQQSDLMWAHYAQNTGFIVEYDTSLFSNHFHNPIQINYLPTDYNLKLNPCSDMELTEHILVLAFLKKQMWKYEDEYRLLFFRPKSIDDTNWQLQRVPKKSITKLILGPRFFNDLYDIDKEYDHIIDFNRNNGAIRKLLIDQAIQIGIPIEHAMIELNSRSILNRKIKFDEEQLESGVYQLKYVD